MFANQKPFFRALTLLFSLALAVSLAGACLLSLMTLALQRTALLQASQDTRPMQLERVRSAVTAAAEKYHFDPESVLPLVTEENLSACAGEAVDTLLSLVEGTAGDLPYLTLPGLEQAILEDPLFREQVPAVLRENIARDQASADIETALARAVLPLRVSLMDAAESLAGEKVDALRSLLARKDQLLLITWGAAAASLALLLLLRLTGLDGPRLLIWVESALGAAAILALAGCGLVKLLGLPALAEELSPILAGMLRSLGRRWLLPASVIALAVLIQSEAGITLACRRLRRLHP